MSRGEEQEDREERERAHREEAFKVLRVTSGIRAGAKVLDSLSDTEKLMLIEFARSAAGRALGIDPK